MWHAHALYEASNKLQKRIGSNNVIELYLRLAYLLCVVCEAMMFISFRGRHPECVFVLNKPVIYVHLCINTQHNTASGNASVELF